nr:hypothetical protein [Tanacetum cinerariifolium]
MIAAQVGDLSSYTTKYTSPALTQKVFANMRRVGKGYSRVDTPFFKGMLVPQQAADDVANVAADDVDDVVAEDAAEPAPPSPPPTTTPPPPQKLPSTSQAYHIDLEHADKVLSMHDDEPEPAELKEVIKVVTTAKLMIEIVIVAATTITVAPSAARRRKGVMIRDPEETTTPSTIVHSDPKSKDKGKGIMVEEPKPLKKQAQIEQDELEKEASRALKRKTKSSEQQAAKKQKIDEELEKEASRALKRKTKSSEQQAAKKQKIDEELLDSSSLLNFGRLIKWGIVTWIASSSLEESKRRSWFSKSQKLEIIRVMWSAYHSIYNYIDDLAGREKISVDKVYFRADAEQCKTYKDLSDSIKKTSVQTKDHADSLIVQLNYKSVKNADLKVQLQEKVFMNVAIKNELRKLKGNSVDTKFAKPSILGKSVLQPPRNQSVVRQPNAFKSERPNFSKPRFASQVDVNNVLSKPVTPHYLPKVRESTPTKPHHDYDGIPKRPTMYLNLWSYKAVRNSYSNPMIQPEPEGSIQGYPLVSVKVLRSILTDSQVTPTNHRRMTNPYSSPRFIANYFNARYLKMEVKVPDSNCLKDS